MEHAHTESQVLAKSRPATPRAHRWHGPSAAQMEQPANHVTGGHPALVARTLSHFTALLCSLAGGHTSDCLSGSCASFTRSCGAHRRACGRFLTAALDPRREHRRHGSTQLNCTPNSVRKPKWNLQVHYSNNWRTCASSACVVEVRNVDIPEGAIWSVSTSVGSSSSNGFGR